MNHLSHPTALQIAAVLSFLMGVFSVMNALAFLLRGAADINQELDSPPYVVVVLAFALAVVMVEVAAYRIVQEAVNNALKHAQASLITVTLAVDDRSDCPPSLHLVIRDNGVGLPAAHS